MELSALSQHGWHIRALFEGLLEAELDRALERLARAEQWEILAIVAITANEVPARRIAIRLLQHGRFRELVLPACFRRQVRRQEIITTGGRGRRVFRDIDAEEDIAGIPRIQ